MSPLHPVLAGTHDGRFTKCEQPLPALDHAVSSQPRELFVE
jgi:hypothetical protein